MNRDELQPPFPPGHPATSGPHTDQCIRDAARYGFCDHTVLTASPQAVRARTRARETFVRPLPGWRRDTAAWTGMALLTTGTVVLAAQIGWKALLIAPAFGLGWLLVFTCGLPRGLEADLSRILPPDARERLGLPPQPPQPPSTPRS